MQITDLRQSQSLRPCSRPSISNRKGFVCPFIVFAYREDIQRRFSTLGRRARIREHTRASMAAVPVSPFVAKAEGATAASGLVAFLAAMANDARAAYYKGVSRARGEDAAGRLTLAAAAGSRFLLVPLPPLFPDEDFCVGVPVPWPWRWL